MEAERGSVILVGYEDRDNLGLRYLLAAARKAGFSAELALYSSDPAPLLELVRRRRPILIGFSLIFQYMAPDFANVIGALRAGGVTAHVTMGGHYPSFDYGEVLTRIPGVDSVVRFEGEATLVELLERLASGGPWRDVAGLARRDLTGEVQANPLRPPVEDLDTLPLPFRGGLSYEEDELPTASILASRGCPWDCTFCSIRPFYEAQGGKLRRLRAPARVVEEMVGLHRGRGVRCFLFQDDDFLAGGRRAREWAMQIADGLVAAGVAGDVGFKISCRSDEVDEPTMARLIEGGLTHVYMGVESGDVEGLKNMSKRISPDEHLEAGRILKKLGLSFDFGFMLLEPYTTLQGIANNVEFLERFVGDGWTVATFCRTLPYSGTPLKAQLEREGRMRGTPFEPDYVFLDPKVDLFYEWMLPTFQQRNFTNSGLGNVLKSMLFEAHLRMNTDVQYSDGERDRLHELTAVCNRIACYTVRAAVTHIEENDLADLRADPSYLTGLTKFEHEQERQLSAEVAGLYCQTRPGNRQRPRARAPLWQRAAGAFESSWTAPAARRAPTPNVANGAGTKVADAPVNERPQRLPPPPPARAGRVSLPVLDARPNPLAGA